MPALDGVRAIGILLVFVHHMITPVAFGGHVGVDVFFVLSGYLITDILLRERKAHGGIRLKRFYFRRAARLYPALLVVVAALLIPGALFAPSLGKYLLENVLAVTYTTPLALEISGGAAWAWRHTWSLGIEEMFYLVWPLLLMLVLGRGRAQGHLAGFAVGGGLALLLASVALEVAGQPGSLLLRSGGLFLGCALAIFLGRKQQVNVPAIAAWSGLALIGASVAGATIFHPASAAPVLMTGVGSVVIIAHLVQNRGGVLAGILGWAPLAYLGRISYELYLWHYPLLIILAWAFDADPIAVAWIAAPMSIGLAAVTHAFLAPRVERLKARVSG
ncbi:acyltransferase family protein [Cryobacterium sp. W22_MBD10_FK3]|uniref:acyltransferase family protein n=1 Tax=Cryobacterium sp. W22_MBD10_FK3 TaxID=3240273 RepID=UPI003F90A275